MTLHQAITNGANVAVYARVSGRQNAAMLRELRAFCKRRRFKVVKEYVDRVTGVITSRRRRRRDQAYVELMNDAVMKRFTCVVVWKFDRFARSLSGLIEGLQTLQGLGIDFISVTEAIDTTTPQGRMVFHVIGSFAEFEREMIVDRVRAGLANARAKGTTLGRPPDVWTQTKVWKLQDKGLTISAIARAANCSRAGVRKILARRAAPPKNKKKEKGEGMTPPWAYRDDPA
jgi:DNA invertase Pin-like site-specific DNA recombinase